MTQGDLFAYLLPLQCPSDQRADTNFHELTHSMMRVEGSVPRLVGDQLISAPNPRVSSSAYRSAAVLISTNGQCTYFPIRCMLIVFIEEELQKVLVLSTDLQEENGIVIGPISERILWSVLYNSLKG